MADNDEMKLCLDFASSGNGATWALPAAAQTDLKVRALPPTALPLPSSSLPFLISSSHTGQLVALPHPLCSILPAPAPYNPSVHPQQ